MDGGRQEKKMVGLSIQWAQAHIVPEEARNDSGKPFLENNAP